MTATKRHETVENDSVGGRGSFNRTRGVDGSEARDRGWWGGPGSGGNGDDLVFATAANATGRSEDVGIIDRIIGTKDAGQADRADGRNSDEVAVLNTIASMVSVDQVAEAGTVSAALNRLNFKREDQSASDLDRP